jgi:hypothetical protein
MTNTSHLAITPDGGVVLDLNHDRLLKLNTVGTEMWSLLSRGMSEEQVVENIVHRYSVEPLRVREDLRSLLRRASELELSPESVLTAESLEISTTQEGKSCAIPVQDQNALGGTTTIGGLLKAIVGLVLFDVILSCLSLETLCSTVRSWPVKPLPSTGKTAVIAQVCRTVERASVWYPKKALCLQRSAVTTCLLRERGIRAQMVVGVRAMPFLAHAWVEVSGRVVNDLPRVKSFYQSLASY